MSRSDLPENFDILAAVDRAWERAGKQIADNYDNWIIEETDKEYRRRKKNRRRRRKFKS